jgi:hypothetical protein
MQKQICMSIDIKVVIHVGISLDTNILLNCGYKDRYYITLLIHTLSIDIPMCAVWFHGFISDLLLCSLRRQYFYIFVGHKKYIWGVH